MTIIDKTLQTNHPYFGSVQYDADGNPICHICGKAFKKVLAHVWQKHNISAREYKIMFGLEVKKGILNEESRDVLRKYIKKNYNKVVVDNLLEHGKESRFTYGSTGRTRDKVSEQTRRKLINNISKTKTHNK